MGLPCLPARDLPDPGIEPGSLSLAGGFLTTSTTWEAHLLIWWILVSHALGILSWICFQLQRGQVMTKLDSILKSRDITLPTKVRLVKAMVFPVVVYGCENWTEENWVPKNWCFWTVVLEKTLESPLDCKEIQPVHPKGDKSWVFIGRTDAEAETPILWPPDVKSWLIGKDPDAGKNWGQEKGTTEDEMAGWYHQLNGHEFE